MLPHFCSPWIAGVRFSSSASPLDWPARSQVGCGALGCEYLKGLSLIGVGVGPAGKVTVTDMDTIETSNLSRQFLFRSTDVGSSKSVTGARVVKEWNPAMNVEGIEQFVGPTTEGYFTDGFWEHLDLCWNVRHAPASSQQMHPYGSPVL